MAPTFDPMRAALQVMLHEARELNARVLKQAGVGPFDLNAIRQAEQAIAEPDTTELRPDGERVPARRWEWGIRRIVAILWDNRHAFEVDEVVEAVRKLAPQRVSEDGSDDEALVAAAARGFAPAQTPGTAAERISAKLAALPIVRHPEIDGEESDGTPRYWRDRPFVSLRKTERIIRETLAAGR